MRNSQRSRWLIALAFASPIAIGCGHRDIAPGTGEPVLTTSFVGARANNPSAIPVIAPLPGVADAMQAPDASAIAPDAGLDSPLLASAP